MEPLEKLQAQAAEYREMFKAVGVEVPDTKRQMAKAMASAETMGVIIASAGGPKDMEQEARRRRNRAISDMISAYRSAMEAALKERPVGAAEVAARDSAIYTARRVLVASASDIGGTITPAHVAEVDRHLGLPPVTPELGFAA